MIIEDWTYKYLDEIPKWRKYIERYLFSDRVQLFIDTQIKGMTITTPPTTPHIVISNTCGARTGGQTWYYKSDATAYIEVSSWMLEDIKELRGILRHELAHYVKEYCQIKAPPHGKEFYDILKIVSPKYYNRDKHWHTSFSIEKARRKIHPRSKPIRVGSLWH